jgi:hypothetical protein
MKGQNVFIKQAEYVTHVNQLCDPYLVNEKYCQR